MKRLVALFACAALTVAAPVLAQATKTARGSVTAVSGSSLTVSVAGKDMTFNVDGKTKVVAKGGSTAAKNAQAEGKSGPALAEVIKTGQAVEVVYHEQGMHADTVKAIAAVPPPPAADKVDVSTKAQNETGVVSAVTGNSLTVKGKAGDSTFTVDNKTTVSGTGLGTAGRKLAQAGGKPTISEFVHEGDTVAVTYHDVGGTKTASLVRLVRKKM